MVLKCREERAAGSATNDAPRVDRAVDDIFKSASLTKNFRSPQKILGSRNDIVVARSDSGTKREDPNGFVYTT